MNRRELAKNGICGLFGILAGKVMPKEKPEQMTTTRSNGSITHVWVASYETGADGKAHDYS